MLLLLFFLFFSSSFFLHIFLFVLVLVVAAAAVVVVVVAAAAVVVVAVGLCEKFFQHNQIYTIFIFWYLFTCLALLAVFQTLFTRVFKSLSVLSSVFF